MKFYKIISLLKYLIIQPDVWRSNNGWRTPLFNSLETISRLNYFDLLDNMAVLRNCSEQEAIELCLSELSSF
ncbi:MAG: hypothetical protein WAX77_13380 [Methylococcaceae bacterium]